MTPEETKKVEDLLTKIVTYSTANRKPGVRIQRMKELAYEALCLIAPDLYKMENF